MQNSSKKYLMLISLSLIWGSSFILMKKGLSVYSYNQVASLRLFIAFIFLFPFCISAFKRVKKKHILSLLTTGVLGNAIPAFLFAKSQTQIDSSLAGVLNSLTPIFTLIIGVSFFSLKVNKTNIAGIIIGLSALIFLPSNYFNDSYIYNTYVWYIILATICYAISINVIKEYLHDLNAIYITSTSFLFIGPIMAVYLFNSDFLILARTREGGIALFYILILSVIGTALAVVLFNYLLKKSSSLFASSVTYLIPIVAIFWGSFDGEEITIYHLLIATIVLFSVYLIRKKNSLF